MLDGSAVKCGTPGTHRSVIETGTGRRRCLRTRPRSGDTPDLPGQECLRLRAVRQHRGTTATAAVCTRWPPPSPSASLKVTSAAGVVLGGGGHGGALTVTVVVPDAAATGT